MERHKCAEPSPLKPRTGMSRSLFKDLPGHMARRHVRAGAAYFRRSGVSRYELIKTNGDQRERSR